LAPGKADEKYLNTGDPNGKAWIPAETDVSIRPGWFYHPAEDSKVKTGKELVNLYYQSVGRNSLLLLNIPPNRQGLFSEPDVTSLHDFRRILNETFKTNLAQGKLKASVTDNQFKTFITVPVNKPLELDFKTPITFDRALFQENIAEGQRVEAALLEYWNGQSWQKLDSFTTIGYKRLLRFPAVKTSKVRLTITQSKLPAQLAEVGFYQASAGE
jgi:alpha-L-fucosidase